MLPLIAAAMFAPGPLDRLVGKWTSIETVMVNGQKRQLKLRGENRWVFKDKLLEIHENYTVEGDPKPGENHILMRATSDGHVLAWWHFPDANEPIVLQGKPDSTGMVLTDDKSRIRISYVWDGQRAYDAKLEVFSAGEKVWKEQTVARYTKR